ncbi:MAG: hypothetical protein AAFZ80_10210 [Cyanobacteria bacterium P01_A01_bin.105]
MVGGLAGAVRAETDSQTVALSFDVPVAVSNATPGSAAMGLSFELGAATAVASAVAPTAGSTTERVAPASAGGATAETHAQTESATPTSATNPAYELADLFVGASDSLVAHAVGHAEGTRTADGGYTRYYNGHTDPGNGVWNLGTFSYQHGARSVAEADAKQLARLQRQATELQRQAVAKGIELTLLEELNGIDLANQAPTTALDRGYIKWLDRAKRTDMGEAERVVWARTRSFIHPDTGRWNAPGLGNTLESVTRDQRRRQQAISKVLEMSPARLE